MPVRELLPLDPPRGGRLSRVFEYADAHMDEPLSLNKAAEIAGLEHTYFSKLFHRLTGVTFVEWNRTKRIGRAKLLLSRSDVSIIAIAFAVGYLDHTTFCRAFRKSEGLSPRKYRMICRAAARVGPQLLQDLVPRSSRIRDPSPAAGNATKTQETPNKSQETPRPATAERLV